MAIKIHPHALQRMKERGASEKEVIKTIKVGERFPAKFGREGFRRNFHFGKTWRDKQYQTKQVEAYTVKDKKDLIVITVVVKYF